MKSALNQHIETVHEVICYKCDQCEYKATIKGALTKHIESIHEGIHYNCDQCEFMAAQKADLK